MCEEDCNLLAGCDCVVHLSLLASLSDSKRARISPFLTGPLTFLTKLLLVSFMNTTFTWVIPPLEPIINDVNKWLSEGENRKNSSSSYTDAQLFRHMRYILMGWGMVLTGLADDFLDFSICNFTVHLTKLIFLWDIY